MSIGKWNFQTHKYEPYELPGYSPLLCDDMDEKINCANCGKEVTFGECLTSRRIHTEMGMGYPVCDDCYDEERALEKAAKAND